VELLIEIIFPFASYTYVLVLLTFTVESTALTNKPRSLKLYLNVEIILLLVVVTFRTVPFAFISPTSLKSEVAAPSGVMPLAVTFLMLLVVYVFINRVISAAETRSL
jgi:hypothetical protein